MSILTDLWLPLCKENKCTVLKVSIMLAMGITILALALSWPSCDVSSDDSITAPMTVINPSHKLSKMNQAINKNTQRNSHNVNSFLYIKGEMNNQSIMITVLLAFSGVFVVLFMCCAVIVFKKPSFQPVDLNNIELKINPLEQGGLNNIELPANP